LWDVQRGKCVRLFTTSALASSDATGLSDGFASTKVDRGHPTFTKSILSLAASPDGTWCASGGDDGSVVVWELSSGRVLRRFGPPTFGGKADYGDRMGSPVNSLSFSQDSGSLVAGYSDGFVRVWDLKRGHSDGALIDDSSLLCAVKTKRTPIHKVTFSPRNLILSIGPFLPF
jgi:WD40 repeat protein